MCRAAGLSEGEPPQSFFGIFSGNFWVLRVVVSRRRWPRQFGLMDSRKSGIVAPTRRATGPKRRRGEAASICAVGGRVTLAGLTQTRWATFCVRSKGPFKEGKAESWQRANQKGWANAGPPRTGVNAVKARAGFPLKPAVGWLRGHPQSELGRAWMACRHGV